MIPLRDSIQPHTVPVVNYALIALCAIAFFFQLTGDDGGARIVEQFGMVPARLTAPQQTPVITIQEAVQTSRGVVIQQRQHPLAPPVVPFWVTLLTCMFLHGGWMHFLGNMWFLHIFGDNVEDRFGHIGYLAMYLLTGLVAGGAHLITNPTSPVPTIGASGAIAGVMGAYALLFPHARVQAFIPLLFIFPVFVLPAQVFLGIWFVMQTLNGMAAMGATAATGVAWWAHIGGFVAGLVAAIFIRLTSLGRPAVTQQRKFANF